MEVLIYLMLIGVFVLVMRFLGAWMLRINELIKNQERQIRQGEEVIKGLKKLIEK